MGSILRSAVLRGLLVCATVLAASACKGKVTIEGGDGGGPESCDPGEVVCEGVCTDLQTDFLHCGGCGVSCSDFQACESGGCVAGNCVLPFVACGSSCADLSTDPHHCGACGADCGGLDCVNGECGFGPEPCACSTLCDPIELESKAPQKVVKTVLGNGNHYTSTCVNGDGQDMMFSFTAPTSGDYVFDTLASEFDTVLTVISPASCGVLACNDDHEGVFSQAEAHLKQLDTVFIVVDQAGTSDLGGFVLNITLANPSCLPCGVYSQQVNPESELCPGLSTGLYEAVIACICEGACAEACGACVGEPPDTCAPCVFDEVAGCGKEVKACDSDI